MKNPAFKLDLAGILLLVAVFVFIGTLVLVCIERSIGTIAGVIAASFNVITGILIVIERSKKNQEKVRK